MTRGGTGLPTGAFAMADKHESRVEIPAVQPKYIVRRKWIKLIRTDLAVDRLSGPFEIYTQTLEADMCQLRHTATGAVVWRGEAHGDLPLSPSDSKSAIPCQAQQRKEIS